MKTLLQHRSAGKVAGLFLFLLPGLAMAHPGHGGHDAADPSGLIYHFSGPGLMILAAVCVRFFLARGSRKPQRPAIARNQTHKG